MTDHPEFSAWLDLALRGLPEKAAQASRAELAAHFEDACAWHLEHGLPPSEAASLALSDLGPAKEVSRGLRETHLGRHLYRVAVWLCLWNLLMQPVVQFAIVRDADTGPTFVAIFALLFPTMLVLDTLRQMFDWRLPLLHARVLTTLTMIGVCLTTVAAMLVNIMNVNRAPFVEFNLAFGVGLALTGVSLLGLALIAFRLGRELAGLGRPLALVTGLMALGQLLLSLGRLTTSGDAALRCGYGLVTVAHVALWPALMLMFRRMSARRPIEPIPTA